MGPFGPPGAAAGPQAPMGAGQAREGGPPSGEGAPPAAAASQWPRARLVTPAPTLVLPWSLGARFFSLVTTRQRLELKSKLSRYRLMYVFDLDSVWVTCQDSYLILI